MIERAVLGRTGIEVSRLCLGCWQAAGWSTCDDDQFVTTVRHALDLGINFLDTAQAYGAGHSEELVGKAIAGRRDQVVLATKLNTRCSRPDLLRKSLDEQLQRLGTDYVDLYQQHWPSPDVPLMDTLGELERLKEEGKIRAVGVSNWMEPEWAEIDDPGRVDVLQPCYSLLWRSVEKSVLALCREHGIAVIPYSPLCQGILAGKFRSLEDVPTERDPRQNNQLLTPEKFPRVLPILDALSEVAGRYGKSMAQTALRWLLDQEGVTAPIVGASRPEQVDRNLGAFGWQLAGEDRDRLAEVSWPLSAELKPHSSLWNYHPRGAE